MTTELDTDLGSIAAELRASTVRVEDERGAGAGSGIVWNDSGLVLTNAHVVRGRSAWVIASGGQPRPARVVRRDAQRDLAALVVDEAAGLVPARTRNSQTLVPGELVVAAGNPLGLVGAVTAGLVHRCNARWVVADVRLAPGNSGGPLADAWGRVVGVNSMIAGGLALAVPTSAAAAFLEERTERKLGVRITPVVLRAGGRPLEAQLVVAVEPDSAAERAGVTLGDAIVARDAAAVEVLRAGKRLRLALAWPEDAHAA
jgi:serine protease Do